MFFNGSFETYTRYHGLEDESKKVLDVFNGIFLSNLVGDDHSFFLISV